jgi:hypothetical protein
MRHIGYENTRQTNTNECRIIPPDAHSTKKDRYCLETCLKEKSLLRKYWLVRKAKYDASIRFSIEKAGSSTKCQK